MLKLRQAIVVEGKYDKNTLSQLVDAPIFVTNGFGIFKDQESMALLRAVAERRGLIVLTDSDGAGLVIRNRLKSVIPPQYLLHAYIPDIPGKEKRKLSPGKAGLLGVEGMKPAVLLTALRNAGATFQDEPEATNAGTSIACPPSLQQPPKDDVGTSIACPPSPQQPPKDNVGTSIACPPSPQQPLKDNVGTSIACPPSPQHTPKDGVGTSIACPPESAPITKTDLYELGLSGSSDSREKRLALQRKLGLPEHLSAGALLTVLNCMYTRSEFLEYLEKEMQ